MSNKKHTRDLSNPQRHFLKRRENKGENLPACAFQTSFLGQYQEWQYLNTSFSFSFFDPCLIELIIANCVMISKMLECKAKITTI